MMKKMIHIIMILAVIGALILPNGLLAKNEKLGQTGFQFLSVVSDARAAGMADAMTSLQIGSSALFFNPAGMASMSGMIDGTASVNSWIAEIQHNTFSIALSPADGNYGVIGFSFQSVNYGDFYGTRVNKGLNAGYEDTGIFTLSANALGVGYAKRLTDRFSVGGQYRMVYQDLGNSVIPLIQTLTDTAGVAYQDTSGKTVSSSLSPYALDFGTQFKTGYKSLVFGMSVRNFSKEIMYVEEGFQLPLVFNLGISMDLMDVIGTGGLDQTLYMSIDASHYRSHREQLNIGLDYNLMKMLSVRTGYTTGSDESGLSFGLGVSKFGFTFDYAYTPYGVFGNVQRMTVRFAL
jgi:hypothetical protein